MTDKEKIRAEIERLHELHRGGAGDCYYRLALRTVLHYIDSLQEEPISEDLEKELARLLKDCEIDSEYIHQDFLHIVANHFANWQKQQMEAYRIEHCKSLTNEQAELEDNFVSSHVEKNNRIPTFIDAIEYGIEYGKQQMMAKAVKGDITFDYYGDDDKTYGCIAHDSFCLEDFGLEDRDKVKVIVIKED